MDQKPLISIIIPVYNHKEALFKALFALSCQTYRPIEIIIIDDGSNEPLRVPKKQVSIDIPVQVVRQENKGAPAARNHGFSLSSGEYVLFLDADIISKPHMLENMISTLQSHPEASYVYAGFHLGHKKIPALLFSSERLNTYNYIPSTVLLRREVVLPWDEDLKRFQDWDLWLSLLKKGHIGFGLDEYLYEAIPRKGGISHWLPSFCYTAPFRWIPGIHSRVLAFEKAKDIIYEKHHLH